MTLTDKEIQDIKEEIKSTETVGELTKAIIAQVDKSVEHGKVAMNAYIENMQVHFPDKTLEECTEACHHNISYLIGYYDAETAMKVRKALDLINPCFLN